MKVMLIDGAEAVRERLSGVLSDLPGIEVMIQVTGTETLFPIIQRNRPDVVIIDINMTGGRGLDLIRGIREKGEYPVVIVLSSSSNLQYRRKCIEAGAMYFFDKVREQDWLFDTVLALKEELE
jgi:DNA-binding NarL/FixJ family response regulator